jgi:DNA-binding NtrC family response regulator
VEATTLVVSPNETERFTYAEWLRADGCPIVEAASAQEAIARHRDGLFPLTLAELDSPALDSVELIRAVRQTKPQAQFVVLGRGSCVDRIVVAAMQAGAADVLPKPVAREALLQSVRKIRSAADSQQPRLSNGRHEGHKSLGIVAHSPQLLQVLAVVARVAPRDTTVLISGESGTGKELIARAVHENSARAQRPMLSINCAAIPETLLESELFGYRKGAFTGATADKEGLLATADGGTLFLDEVAELPLWTQAKLLRFLQEGTYFPVGSVTPSTADVRLISATNASLLELVDAGRFRRDLYYRLAVFPVHIPPLRERPEDIVPLAHHILRQIAEEDGREVPGLSHEVLPYLTARGWRGNVRELQSAVVRAVIMSDKSLLTSADFRVLDTGTSPRRNISQLPDEGVNLPELNRKLIAEALERSHYNLSAAARLLGMTRATLRSRVKKYALSAVD